MRTTTTDSSGNVTQDISWTYNSSEKVSSMTESIGSFSTTYNYAYDNDKRPVSVSFGGIIGAIAYDGFSRMISQTVTSGGNTVLTTDYTYRNIDGTYTSTQVASLSNSYGDEEDSYSYTYDANGNITGISGSQTAQYAYDALGQLITETVGTGDDQYVVHYSYDNGGNLIRRVKEYTVAVEEPEPDPEPEPNPEPEPEPDPEPEPEPTPTPTPKPTPDPSITPKPIDPIPVYPPITPPVEIMGSGAAAFSVAAGSYEMNDSSDSGETGSDRIAVEEITEYTYGDSTWGDLLTAYDGQAITYDGIGNPLSYRSWTMSWQGGRQLAAMTGASSSLSFDYGESGLRLSKTCTVDDSSTVHTYTWNGSLLSSDICGNTALYFHYDTSGSPMGFTLVNGEGSTEYFYVRNLQGDILKVIDAAGTVHASYTYDAWGNILSSSGTLADVNPLRYRGYYYDAETGFYYVSSRYYDPEIGRFINPDDVDLLGANGDFASLNLFAYCGNNPVSRADSNGHFWHLVVGGVIGGIIGAITSAASGGDVVDVLIGAAAGAAGGVLAASGAGVVVQALGSAVLSMTSNAASQINNIIKDKTGNTKFDVGDMFFDGAVGLVCGAWGKNGASYGNTEGIKAAGKQLFKRGFFNPQARSYYAKVAHNMGGEYVFKSLLKSLGKSTIGSTIITVKNIIRYLEE